MTLRNLVESARVQEALCVLANDASGGGAAGREWSIVHLDGREFVVFGVLDRPALVERIHALFLDEVRRLQSHAEAIHDDGTVEVIVDHRLAATEEGSS